MKLLIIQLSDLHFENTSQTHSVNIEKMIAAMKSNTSADECVIVISGDLANKGKSKDYRYVKGFTSALLRSLNNNGYTGKKIHVLSVPGNHDIDFSNFDMCMKDIIDAYNKNTIIGLRKSYLNNMKNYFLYATEQGCFLENKVISKKIIQYGDKKIGFVLCNSAPLSLLGGNAEDMGSHYFSEDEMKIIDEATDADFNILILHHSIEWLKSTYKDKLRRIISRKYSLVLSGHEHTPYGESNNMDNTAAVQFIQGNALHGYAENGNGFCTVTIDFNDYKMEGYSYIWRDSIYLPEKIVDSEIRRVNLCDEILLRNDFQKQMMFDSSKRCIDNYYVFPGVAYNVFDENENIRHIDIDTEQEMFEFIDNKESIVVTGEHKAGKTILAKRIFCYFLNKGKKPIFIEASAINKKKIERTIDYIFPEEYCEDDFGYEKYKQLDKRQKVAIIDEADMLQSETLHTLIMFLKQSIAQVIVFSEDKVNLNVRKQVVDALVYEETLTLKIKPFLYDRRKHLISNILQQSGKCHDVENETNKINNLINMQVKYFDLDPEFIISFVNQYEMDMNFKLAAGMNVFNVVYESNIRNNIILNSDSIDPTHVINILRELAYKMHFEKRNNIKIDEVGKVIEVYKQEYRQKVNIRTFLETVLRAKILIESDDELRFKDHTVVAYFVAQALNQKYNQGEDIENNLELLLKNLCFSINSDIILFLALITNNPKFINIIAEGARKHFEDQEELSFDRKNLMYILDTKLPVKDSFPDKEERKQREKDISKQEETIKLNEIIELVNEYDYTEKDLEKIENQVMISLKYIEVLSKSLPAFCQNMKVEQQDKLVDLIYRCPNKFLFSVLIEIGEDFEGYCNELHHEITALRKEKNADEISVNSVRKALEQMSSIFIVMLYQLVASTCANEQSILALNEFDYQNSTNYSLQNLMMAARIDDVNLFSQKAKKLDKQVDNNLSKTIIKYTVRDYFLRNNNVELYGEAQSLMDQFFKNSASQEIRMNMARKRMINKNRT